MSTLHYCYLMTPQFFKSSPQTGRAAMKRTPTSRRPYSCSVWFQTQPNVTNRANIQLQMKASASPWTCTVLVGQSVWHAVLSKSAAKLLSLQRWRQPRLLASPEPQPPSPWVCPLHAVPAPASGQPQPSGRTLPRLHRPPEAAAFRKQNSLVRGWS